MATTVMLIYNTYLKISQSDDSDARLHLFKNPQPEEELLMFWKRRTNGNSNYDDTFENIHGRHFRYKTEVAQEPEHCRRRNS